ncbi:hypothetical protein [Lacunisphaera limnophila]|uniref:hypothetical protein n=1 Tax=Lacunisphaera limnophila TaxID=1838286 RepID=UPI0012FD9490|nr:hypothetical protein [Lacunisphaera limnophila]
MNDPVRNQEFRNACQRLAVSIDQELGGMRCLVYAPLRGALPIWRVVSQFLKHAKCDVYYPVTSSFISYPISFEVQGTKKRPISGRYANVLELQRLKPFLGGYDAMLYIDEIVSGSMMQGHIKEMLLLEINRLVPIVAAGIADRNGRKSIDRRSQITAKVTDGLLRAFFWEGCPSLITEDQKYLLGIHYADYTTGPNIVPFLNEKLGPYPEREAFEKEVFIQPAP